MIPISPQYVVEIKMPAALVARMGDLLATHAYKDVVEMLSILQASLRASAKASHAEQQLEEANTSTPPTAPE